MRTLPGMMLLAAIGWAQGVAIPAGGRGRATPAAAQAGRGRGSAPASAAAATAGGGLAMPKDLKYPPLHTIQAPVPAVFTLANGMKLYLLEDHDLPLVGGIALVRTGSVVDAAERTGLAQIAGIAMRTGGAGVKTGEQLDAVLDNMASTMESSIGEESGAFSFSGLKENAGTTLGLFKEMLTQPGFRADKIRLAKSQLSATISHRNDNGGAIAKREFARLVYGKDTPFGRQVEYDTLGRVSRGDLRAFHQRYFFPANLTLGVWGDFNGAEMKALVEKVFADWTVKQEAVPEFPKGQHAAAPGVFLAEVKDTTRVYFTMGHLAGAGDEKDRAALEVFGSMVSGARARIAERLRTPLDLAAEWSAGYGETDLFQISGGADPVSAVAVVKAVREEIERLRTAEAGEEEWRSARDGAVTRLIFAEETRARWFAHQMALEFRGYPKDYLERRQKELESVTRADVLRAARQYINPENFTVVVAANPILLGDPLEKLGPVTKLDVTIPEARPETVEKTDASLAEGKQMLLKAQAAAGGAEKLAAVKDYTAQSEFTFDPALASVRGTRITQTEKWVAPSTFRQEAILAIGRVALYTDGKIGWVSTPQGWGALTGAQRTQVLGDLFRVYFRLLLSDRMEGRTVNAIEDSTLQIGDAGGEVTTVEFDADSHLLKRMSWDAPRSAGGPMYQEEVYDDFREVAGVKIPFKITVNEGGHKLADVVVKEYRINTGLSAQELARRPQ